MRRRAVAGLALAAAIALPAAAAAGESASRAPTIETDRGADRAADRAHWQARFHEAREAVARAQTRHDEALEAYRKVRHRRRQRGEEKQKVLDELTDSETALQAAESALRELFDTARRAGVPPGWMRMPHGDLPAAPEPAADDADEDR